ncbi:nuclear transport factor 2 family protein [Saccharopolyspora phatthalungensis]|uniref:Ketosteroid isomerase-like protein n=1 Tax=Saccharopolyspora phatthalungensis TaxID=664693 RepID=A0A840QG14_9PSEU|nr:nuclear transport factor 2 family protein [Saccharopolyspora phatthalungensis]MBB5159396.1 ketosteroid isomerase-like protein [Saccharopolyspora phatthalungensis]
MPVVNLSLEDQAQIHRLLASVAYVLDAHDYDRLGEVFAPDIRFDNPGRLTAEGLPALIDAFKGIAQPALSHHITNVVVSPEGPDTAACVSKALTLRSTGVVTAAEYRDVVHRTDDGWRISARIIRPLG